ncbi:hypothetical protein ACET3Z_011620 [Daucus carota]
MDTTPLNTEFNHGRIQPENKIATTLVTLTSATFLIKVVVTAFVAVNNSAGTTALLVVDSIPAVRTSLAVTSTLAVKAHTAFFTQTDSIVSTQPAVTQMQHPSAVLVEDDYNDDNVLISSFIKGTSKPSSSMDFSTAHTHAFRMSEGEKKKREIKEQRVSKQNERHPKCAGKRRGT